MIAAALGAAGQVGDESISSVSFRQLRRCLVVLRAGCPKGHHDILRLLAAAAVAAREPVRCCPGAMRVQQDIGSAAARWADAGGRMTGARQIWRFSLVRASSPQF